MRNRDMNFGRLLAIANVLGDRVFENDKMSISQKHMSKFSKNPAKSFEKIHAELMEYAPKFKEDEIQLMDLFGEVLAEISESEFNNEPLNAKYLHSYHSQQHDLNDVVGVDEAAKILGLSPGTVKNKCAAGDIVSKKIGKTWVINKEQLNIKEMDKMENLRSWDAIAKLNELLGEDIEEQFNEQEEKTGIDGSQFLVSNSKGLAVEVEIGLSEDEVDTLYTLNTDWAK